MESKYFKTGEIITVEKSFQRLQVIKSLGQGTYGQVYKVKDIQSGDVLAIKADFEPRFLSIEHSNISKLSAQPQVPNLHGEISRVIYENKNRYLMKMDLLGLDLAHIFEKCEKGKGSQNKIFSVQTCCKLGQQMIRIIKDVHDQGILHRDIKPANFCISKDATPDNLGDQQIFLIDFGLSKAYSGRQGKHTPMIEGKKLVGTPRYASLATHMGYEQSRRDDLEVIGNTLIFLLKGSLPWEDYFKGDNKYEEYANIAKKVQETTLEELCEGCPSEFYKFMKYCRSLQFEEQPNYQYLIDLVEQCKMNKNSTKEEISTKQTEKLNKKDRKNKLFSTIGEQSNSMTKASTNKINRYKVPIMKKIIKKNLKIKSIFKHKIRPQNNNSQKRSTLFKMKSYFLRSQNTMSRMSRKGGRIPLRHQNIPFHCNYIQQQSQQSNLGFVGC